jgi:valyl-tRNA synthetase
MVIDALTGGKPKVCYTVCMSTKSIKPVPEKATVDGIEDQLIQRWDEAGIYFYDKSSKGEVFSIDTPPPTVSGSLHVGHVFSYTHTDLMARYKRMQGFNVFYPMGFDDNGLPTERRVQNFFGVRPDLSVEYDPNFKPPQAGGDDKSSKAANQLPISRQNFIELCQQLCSEDEVKFKELWQMLGVSVDWRQTYQTIDDRSRGIAQKMFLRNLKRGEAYQQEAPGLWDVTFQTAVAQAELEAREYAGAYHKLAFHTEDGDDVVIETTRPELLISCVALIAHPNDDRYKHLFGKTVQSPIFGVKVPVIAHTLAEIDKGSGILMCCTFGDQTDVVWWRELNLPLRSVIQKNGRLDTTLAFEKDSNPRSNADSQWVSDPKGVEIAKELNGKTPFSAREIIVNAVKESGEMIGDPVSTMRMTNFFEKGDKPLEIVTSKQWYIKNGGKDKALNDELLKRGEELDFVPDFMRVRYENWVKGLNNDWLVSRQRFFGVAFPIWYCVDGEGFPDYDNVILPDEADLPLDPTITTPSGYTDSQRGVPGGFVAETDVMDTWATSSLTPQIACGFEVDDSDDDVKASKADFDKLYPMSVRPQGQDIIRTWLFSTVVRAHLEGDQLPWKTAAISGWILDPDHKKMSKSKGNVELPTKYIIGDPQEQDKDLKRGFGADAVRYWAAGGRLGVDTAFETGQMKLGRRLAMKILNVTKFALSFSDDPAQSLASLDKVTLDIDKAIVAQLNDVIGRATASFEKFDHTGALEVAESFFWGFCNDYVEIVKRRAYNRPDEETGELSYTDQESDSAKTAMLVTLTQLLKLLAPFTPFATDEAWSWFNNSSIHVPADGEQTCWAQPIVGIVDDVPADELKALWKAATSSIEVLRRVKTDNKLSMNAAVSKVVLQVPETDFNAVQALSDDLCATLNIAVLEVTQGDTLEVTHTEV